MAHVRVYNVGRGYNDVLHGPAGPIPRRHPNTLHKIRRATGVYLQDSANYDIN